MNISPNVIKDLLPLYFEGALSEDSRRLVQQALEENAELKQFANLLQGMGQSSPSQFRTEDHALSALSRTRRLLARQRWLQGLAIFCTLAPLSFVVRQGEFLFLVVRDSPVTAAVLWALAAALWIAYWRTRQAVML